MRVKNYLVFWPSSLIELLNLLRTLLVLGTVKPSRYLELLPLGPRFAVLIILLFLKTTFLSLRGGLDAAPPAGGGVALLGQLVKLLAPPPAARGQSSGMINRD